MPVKAILAALIAGIALCALYVVTFPLIICENCAINHAGYWAMTLGVALIGIALGGIVLAAIGRARLWHLAPLALLGMLLGLPACSDTQVIKTNAALDKYDHSLDNFNTIVARYDVSISKTDATARPYCDQAKQVGTNVGQIVKGNNTALKALDGLSGALDSYCTKPVTDVASAIETLTRAIANGKAALSKGS